MKVGILTYHSVCNFGANLQCYSTISYLKNNGFDPLVINWLPKDLELKDNREVPDNQVAAHKKFVEENFPLSKICRSSKDIVSVIEKENVKLIIIGSDAVLQYKTLLDRIKINRKGIFINEKLSNLNFPNPFWGDFMEDLHEKIPIALMSVSSQNMNYMLIKGALRKKNENSNKSIQDNNNQR